MSLYPLAKAKTICHLQPVAECEGSHHSATKYSARMKIYSKRVSEDDLGRQSDVVRLLPLQSSKKKVESIYLVVQVGYILIRLIFRP